MGGPDASRPPRRRPPVAFIDESYRYAPSNAEDDYYVLAAVLLDGAALNAARTSARACIRPVPEFHATDLWHAGDVGTLHRMLEHIRDETGWNIVTIQAPFMGHADDARQACLERLLIELDSHKVGHVVCDSRFQPAAHDPYAHDRADQHTLRALRSAGRVSRHMTMGHATDASESLLWLPDGVAWATRRALALDDNAHYEIIRDVTTLLVIS